MKLITSSISILILFVSCSIKTHSENFPIGKFESVSGEFSIEIKESNDSLKATHCFVFSNGNVIDCCLDDISINLSRKSETEYQGLFHSCYDENDHEIKLNYNNDTLSFVLLNDYSILSKQTIVLLKK
jgi:hypothetical protein